MAWKLTVRTEGRVETDSFDDREPALEELEARARDLIKAAPKASVKRLSRYEPVQQVFARLELSGPQRLLPNTRVGLDVRGDGSIEAYRGRVRRELLEGDTPYEALRRELLSRG